MIQVYGFPNKEMRKKIEEKLHLEKALLSHSDPRAPPARPFACVPFACWGLARPVCEIVSLLIASGSIEMSHL